MIPKKHSEVAEGIVDRYRGDENVVGVYFFGSMATGEVREDSDIDVEVVFREREKDYELVNERIEGIDIDLSCFSLEGFLKEFYEKTHRAYSILGKNKIVYDPEGVLKKAFAHVEKYFEENPKMREFWEEKERKYVIDKKMGNKKEYFFDVCKEADELVK